LAKNQSQRSRGKISNRGKGVVCDKAHKIKDETKKSYGHFERGGSSQRVPFGRRNYFPQVSGRGRGGEVKCYVCGKT
jgi:hypothetical protein